ncbi:hypothetical protein CONPUDRAFT_153852 [Coniophora puteana RWD-64-598 SS2]|uniref:Uncharacterized protein n=1 Tax=Coniophora puteana (strain RWD-64-598) TaxID=741705 RepID=A0A5M3MQ73_CONPW|nr:uncharacterized protein CONPUDRAFT_153852 [Coniophora puteana RWD-64-598 SS2]EIW81303.1 hypothetical protein CONPUDRAFT_153852 [Coniophora puteana RWD-64-598 SS2]
MDTDLYQCAVSAGDLDDINEKLRLFQVSSKLSNGELLPALQLPPELSIVNSPPNQPPRRAFYGFVVSKDILTDYALRWYQGKFTRESFKTINCAWVNTICIGAAKRHLELDPEHPRIRIPPVDTPDGTKPCVSIYDNHYVPGWNLDVETETRFIEFIRTELELPKTQEPMWYYCHGR